MTNTHVALVTWRGAALVVPLSFDDVARSCAAAAGARARLLLLPPDALLLLLRALGRGGGGGAGGGRAFDAAAARAALCLAPARGRPPLPRRSSDAGVGEPRVLVVCARALAPSPDARGSARFGALAAAAARLATLSAFVSTLGGGYFSVRAAGAAARAAAVQMRLAVAARDAGALVRCWTHVAYIGAAVGCARSVGAWGARTARRLARALGLPADDAASVAAAVAGRYARRVAAARRAGALRLSAREAVAERERVEPADLLRLVVHELERTGMWVPELPRVVEGDDDRPGTAAAGGGS